MQTNYESIQVHGMAEPTTSIPRKRKLSDESDSSTRSSEEPSNQSRASPHTPKGEYETGRVICEVCGRGVSFRDENSGGFTLKHWDAHRQECNASPSQAPAEPVIYTPESTAEALANPPAKRRRAKRTEEERIEYLRSDPHVAQFEAYRVLCASCEKWIRLRPNSTYCSIPWDAHRKSCLSKKSSQHSVSALEERNAILAKDPDARKFDAERVLCNLCDRWVNLPIEDHTEALREWFHHRSSCQKVPEQSSTSSQTLSNRNPKIISSPSAQQSTRPTLHASLKSSSSSRLSQAAYLPVDGNIQPSGSSFNDSRRRGAEQRADALRSDSLLGAVEPHRVFCNMCQKWVQLRHDSSYCAYPWSQHRTKCVLRQQKKNHRLTHSAGARGQHEILSGGGAIMKQEYMEADIELEGSRHSLNQQHSPPDNPTSRPILRRSTKELMAERRDVDILGSVMHSSQRPTVRLADLDSPSGRLSFIFSSIKYLFSTTYEACDDVTISALLTYLNAAMPPDKHEDFDTAEVVRAAAALQDRADIVFEGDAVRLID